LVFWQYLLRRYRRSFDGWRFSESLAEAPGDSIEPIGNLDCDIILAPHPFYFGLKKKMRQGPEAFIDNDASGNTRLHPVPGLSVVWMRSVAQSPRYFSE